MVDYLSIDFDFFGPVTLGCIDSREESIQVGLRGTCFLCADGFGFDLSFF